MGAAHDAPWATLTASLRSVPREPSELRLPTREIVPPKGLWQFVITRVLAVAALGFIMAVGLNHSSKIVIAATFFLGLMTLLAAIQVPLIKRRWRRLEQTRLESLSGDAIYAGPARAESLPGTTAQSPGGRGTRAGRAGILLYAPACDRGSRSQDHLGPDDSYPALADPNGPGCRLARADPVAGDRLRASSYSAASL